MVELGLKALGEFALTCDGATLPAPPTKKARALVAYLVMHRSADISREQLLELFWPGFDPQRGRDNLNATLWSVRRIFRNAKVNPDDVIHADRTVIRWHAPVDFDVDRLFALARSGEEAAAEEALSLYRGDFLEGDFDDWSVSERERIALAYETFLSRATQQFHNIASAEQLIARNPYDETAYTTLIESQLRAGQPLAAAILVERCRRALEEVGTTPSDSFEERFGKLRRPREESQSDLRLPFVARDRELRFLTERFGKLALGLGSITIVHGDAGIGKSTLLAHAARNALEYCSRIIEVRCDDDALDQLRRVGESVADEAAPAVVIIDDAQNLAADALSRFAILVQSASERHCFVVALRPEALVSIRRCLEPSTPFEVRLDSLSRDDLASALRQATGSELSEVSAKLFERTRGHPLYVVRLLEALVESGALEHRHRAWSVTEKFDESLPLPGSVRVFIEARLLSRGKVAAEVAGALAIEPWATAANLGSALALDEEPLLDALDDLLALGLIRQPQAGPQFEFSHDLIREVAGARLNAGRAVRIHKRFAELLREARERNVPGRIGAHLLAAGESLDAAQAFARAAESAFDRGELRDCIAACDRASSALQGLGRSAERDAALATLYRTKSHAQFALGETNLALEAAGWSVDLERGVNAPATLARSLIARARCNAWIGQYELAISDLEEANSLARSIGNNSLVAAALTELSAAARLGADKERALSTAREAYETAVEASDWPGAQLAVGEWLLACCAFGEIDDAKRLAGASLELAQRCAESQQAGHYNRVAVVSYVCARHGDAKRDLARASQLDALPSPPAVFLNQMLSGLIALAERRWSDALEIAARLETTIDCESLPAQTFSLGALRVEALLARDAPGDAEDASKILESMGDESLTHFPWNVSPEITRACVSARLQPGDAIVLRKAMDAAEERAHEMPFDADRAYAQLAVACRRSGNGSLEARADLRQEYYARLRDGAAGERTVATWLPVLPYSRSSEAMPRTSS